MWTISRGICLVILAILSVIDFRYRKVPIQVLVIGNVGAAVYQLVTGSIDVCLILAGAGIGAVFFLVSRVTEEGIGYGDSFGILGLGIFLGIWQLLSVLAGTFLLLLIIIIPVLCIKHMSRKCSLPFFPFLTGGYLAWILAGGV